MKAIKATIMEHAKNCETPHAWLGGWWTKEGGGSSIKLSAFDSFDHHNTRVLVNDRSAFKFGADLMTGTDLSPLENVLAPHIRDIMKHLSSCLHLAF
jgi:hypothetical protein